MMVRSSVRLSASEIHDHEAVACFNAQCVGYQSLWGEGVIGECGGREVEDVRPGVFPLPQNQQSHPPPTTPPLQTPVLIYLQCLLLPLGLTSLTYKHPFYNK